VAASLKLWERPRWGELVASGALAQQKPIKDQLVGAWTLLLDDGVKPDGTQVPIFGPNPAGTLIFTSNGRYSLQIMRVVNRAPFVSNNRETGTADENKAVAQGTISHFGTYTVDDAGKTINFRIEGSSFPNWENTSRAHGRSADVQESDLVDTRARFHPHRVGVETSEMIARAATRNGRREKPDMDRASRYVITREDNVVHVDFDRDTRPPKPTFPGAGALRAESSNSAPATFYRPPLLDEAVHRKAAQG
jgi:hypothetical protein